MTIDGPGVSLSGTSNLVTQTTFQTNYDFEITGEIGGNSGGLVKNGDAVMSLAVDQTYAGFTRINEGVLLVNAGLGGNDVLVNNGGTLGGHGDIASTIEARSGGVVAPGSSTGTLTAGAAEFQDGSTLNLELLSISDFDRLLIDGSITVAPGALLEITLLDGYMPSVGDQFDVLDFAQFNGEFDSFLTPTLSEGSWDFSELSSTGVLRVTAVPEPGTLVLFTLCGAALAIRRRRTQV